MTGQEVDRRVVTAVGRVIEILGAGQTVSCCPCEVAVALEEAAEVVAVLSVPFRPAVPAREAADLIQSAGVPRLGDQLGRAEDRVERKALEQRRLIHRRAVLVASEDGREVKAEAVDFIFGHPVAQAVLDEVAHDRVVAVEHVAAAAEIVVLAVGREHVVDVVVQSLEREEGTLFVTLGGVVEHDVEDDLDAVGLEVADELFQLGALAVMAVVGFIAGVGSEEADRVVAPVVIELFAVEVAVGAHFVEFEDRHQLNRVDAQLLEVRDLLADALEGTAVADARGEVLRKAAHMQLIDDQLLHRDARRLEVAPVVVVEHDARLIDAGVGLTHAPAALTRDRLCVGVEHIHILVENQSLFGIVRSVE